MSNQRGFSLIELLIVVAIIGIIAAIAIPNFTQSRIAANEASAIAAVRTICTAQITYSATFGNGQYTGIANLAACQLIDANIAGAGRNGYRFGSGTAGEGVFTVGATPMNAGITGRRTFQTDQTGILRDSNGNIIGAAAGGS